MQYFHNGVWICSSAGLSYADLGLVAGTAFTYTVAANDAAGNNSASSSKAFASTVAGVTPGLVAYYNFDEAPGASLHDYSRKGNNGAITGATWSSSGRRHRACRNPRSGRASPCRGICSLAGIRPLPKPHSPHAIINFRHHLAATSWLK
jgi:hypothetical protein